MKKFKTLSGYLAYCATAAETTLLGGRGICDNCGEWSPNGYLVPVLNEYMCPECFQHWGGGGTYYTEDIPYEQHTAAYFESRIPLEGDE